MVSRIRLSALAHLATSTPDKCGQGIILQQIHPLTMLNLRGPADTAFCDAVRIICNCDLPVTPNSSSVSPAGEILKLGPNEWLLVANPETPWSEKMVIPRATLTDVSHGRVAVQVDGDKSRDLLTKGCAVDIHPLQLPAGSCIQTNIAKISVILHKQHNDNGFMLYLARSYASSFWHWLTASANEYGYDVLGSEPGSHLHRQ